MVLNTWLLTLIVLELCQTWPAVAPPTLLSCVVPGLQWHPQQLWHLGCKAYLPPQPICICALHAYSYIQQSGRSVKTMNAINTKKSPIHENADTNITCEFGDGDINCCRSRLPASHIVSSIIVRYFDFLFYAASANDMYCAIYASMSTNELLKIRSCMQVSLLTNQLQ